MKRTVNYKVGAQKRKYKLGRADVEPGTFIKLAQAQKATAVSETSTPSETKVAIMGM